MRAFIHLPQALHDADLSIHLDAVVLVGAKVADEFDSAGLVG